MLKDTPVEVLTAQYCEFIMQKFPQLRDGFESVGGENMVQGRYWVKDSFKEGTVVYYKNYNFDKGREGYSPLWTFYDRVRACLVYIYLTN